MAKLKVLDTDQVQKLRRSSSLTQTEYWSRFGVTQSGGSRYETMRRMPMPTAMLIWLFESGKLNEQDLADARKAVKPRTRAA